MHWMLAFEFDEVLLIEPFISGVKEYNLAGFSARGEITYSIVEEPQKAEFLDFEKKYLDFSRSSTVAEASISVNTWYNSSKMRLKRSIHRYLRGH